MGKLEGIRIITNKNVAREAKLPEGEQQISLIISKGVPYMNKGNLWGAGKIKFALTHYNQVVLNKSH